MIPFSKMKKYLSKQKNIKHYAILYKINKVCNILYDCINRLFTLSKLSNVRYYFIILSSVKMGQLGTDPLLSYFSFLCKFQDNWGPSPIVLFLNFYFYIIYFSVILKYYFFCLYAISIYLNRLHF